MQQLLRLGVHAALYAAAALLWSYGLGVSLTGDRTTFGGILWTIALIILVANTVWILRALRRSRNTG